MLSSILTAAFAAGAVVLAVPLQKRDEITDVEVVYQTEVVTVTAFPNWSADSTAASATDASPDVAPTDTWTYVAPTTSAASSTSVATELVKRTSTSSQTSASATPSTYAQKVVLHHNYHRQNHSAPNIAWSNDLASSAATIAASCKYAHNTTVDGGGYGQNIAAGIKANNITAIITNLFYNGEVGWFADYYGESQPSMTYFENWGHFSQIVWKATTEVGCHTQDCSAHGLSGVSSDVPPYFTVCNYKSPGNYENEYGSNIGSPLGHPTAHWNKGL